MTLKDGNRAAIKLQGNQGHTDFIKVSKAIPSNLPSSIIRWSAGRLGTALTRHDKLSMIVSCRGPPSIMKEWLLLRWCAVPVFGDNEPRNATCRGQIVRAMTSLHTAGGNRSHAMTDQRSEWDTRCRDCGQQRSRESEWTPSQLHLRRDDW